MAPRKKSRECERQIERGTVVNSAEQLKEFACFRELPIELRIKIWGHACSVTRNVDIWAKKLMIPGDSFDNDYLYYWYSSCAIPAVLHVSRESRAEGLEHYTPDFATFQAIDMINSILLTLSISTPAQVYINWDNDRLCLIEPCSMDARDMDFEDSMPFQDFANKCVEKRLRYLAINTSVDPFLSDTEEGKEEKATDLSFSSYMPKNAMIEEVVLFENHWGPIYSEGCKVNGLEFVEVRGGDDRRLDFVKNGLTKNIEKVRARDSLAFQTIPLVRICKAILPS